jgi:hypothetical protein
MTHTKSYMNQGKRALSRMADMAPEMPDLSNAEASVGLGLVSIAIGVTECLAPQKLDQFLGTGDGENSGIFRVLGVREIMHGVDLLTHRDATPGVWSRVAGDALDGVLLGIAATKTRRPGGVLAAAAMVLPVVAADLLFAQRLSRKKAEEASSWLS